MPVWVSLVLKPANTRYSVVSSLLEAHGREVGEVGEALVRGVVLQDDGRARAGGQAEPRHGLHERVARLWGVPTEAQLEDVQGGAVGSQGTTV